MNIMLYNYCHRLSELSQLLEVVRVSLRELRSSYSGCVKLIRTTNGIKIIIKQGLSVDV